MAGDPTGPSLDEEGVPDLEGPLPAKAETGDPQEGLAPPGNRPGASADWGTVPSEEQAGEPLERRLAREVPDTPAGDDPLRGRELVGDELYADGEDEAVALAPETDADEGRSAEEAAMHVIDDDVT
jgi:hypothetical protein